MIVSNTPNPQQLFLVSLRGVSTQCMCASPPLQGDQINKAPIRRRRPARGRVKRGLLPIIPVYSTRTSLCLLLHSVLSTQSRRETGSRASRHSPHHKVLQLAPMFRSTNAPARGEVTRHAVGKGEKGRSGPSGLYPFRLNFYSRPPLEEITIEQFEEWALDRLRSECTNGVSLARGHCRKRATRERSEARTS